MAIKINGAVNAKVLLCKVLLIRGSMHYTTFTFSQRELMIGMILYSELITNCD